MELLKRFWNEEEGQDLVEYALLLGFISLAVIAALTTMQGALNTVYQNTASKLTSSAS
ncbi:MAG: Flp family type IVb pilin [Bryobacteraceae bacterium]